MAKTALGITIGSHTLRAVQVRKQGQGWAVLRATSQRLEEELRPEAGRILASKGLKGGPVLLGLTGRDVIIRYNLVPPVPDWRLRNLMKFEVLEVSGQSGGEVSADYRKLNLPDPEGTRSEDTVLVCLARNAYLQPMLDGLTGAGFQVEGGCPSSVGLFSCFAVNATYREDETALLVHVGAQGLDIALERGGELLFARNATPGSQAFTQAIATAFATTEAKAETLKIQKGDVTPRGQARYADSTAEKVANAMVATAGQISQLIQSTLMIARAQTKLPDLKVDRVLLAGGGASLKGLDAYLKQAMGVPVERFDPFSECDLSALPEEERTAIQAAPHEWATALGLAQTPLAPAAFRLAVVPEAVRRRRDFATKGVFAVAAGLVAAAALGLLWTARSAAAEEVATQAAQLKADEARKAEGPHQEFMKEVGRVQEAREKHRRLAELSLPGRMLSDTFALLQSNLDGHPEVWIEEVGLQVEDPVHAYNLLHPKPGKFGGFHERDHRRTERTAAILVKGRVSPGASPDKVFNDFVSECKAGAPARNLLVVTKKTFQAKDGRFELEVRPGITLRPKDLADYAPWMLRGPAFEAAAEGGEPTVVTGTDVEGYPVSVRKEQVDPQDWQAMRELVPATAPAPAPAMGS
ncbi:MAG TPA: pilus assembly protein PilM [Planctomycetota bacterium]|nr:pilus assembly protein PilM [Planctomycetota bacterium]